MNKKMLTAIVAAIKLLQPSPGVHPEGAQNGKEQDTGPRYLRCKSKG